MPYFFLTLFFLLSGAFAGFEGITVKNADLSYARPYGRGEVEKVSLILSNFVGTAPIPIEVKRTDEALVLVAPSFDLVWEKPLRFLHDMERVETKKFNLNLGEREHTSSALYLLAKFKEFGEFKFTEMTASCKGASRGIGVDDRLMDDCREKMLVVSKKVDIPTDFVLMNIINQLPKVPKEMEAPADDFKLTVDKGNFSLLFYFRYFVYAGLRAKGNLSYEDDHNVTVIRVDQIKWGILPVTNIVMRELQSRIKLPNVSITPPYIRIRKAQ